MANNLYITATEARSGKSAVSLGVMEMLIRKINKVGFFRPIINVSRNGDRDNDIDLMATHFNLKSPYEVMYGYTMDEANHLITMGRNEVLLEGILNKYHQLEERYNFILCEGTDYTGATSAFEFDINAAVARNLACPVLLVANGRNKSVEEVVGSIDMTLETLCDRSCNHVAIILNRVEPEAGRQMAVMLEERGISKGQLIYVIPENQTLGNPTVGEIAKLLGARVLWGHDQLNRHVYNFTVAAMQLRNLLPRIEHGALVITPGDRADVIIACLAAVSSSSMSTIAGIVLTGGLLPEEPIWNLIHGLNRTVPILSVEHNTFPTARLIDQVHAGITPENDRKIIRALAHFEKNVNVNELADRIIRSKIHHRNAQDVRIRTSAEGTGEKTAYRAAARARRSGFYAPPRY